MERVREKILPIVSEEIQTVIPEWKDLRKVDDELVCVHTLAVIYCIMQDRDFKKGSKRD